MSSSIYKTLNNLATRGGYSGEKGDAHFKKSEDPPPEKFWEHVIKRENFYSSFLFYFHNRPKENIVCGATYH